MRNGDQRGDKTREEDAEQEERREPEAERPEHVPSLLRGQAGVASRAGLTL